MGCSIANISIFLRKLKQKEKEKYIQLQPDYDPLKDLNNKEKVNFQVDPNFDLTQFGAATWRDLLLKLITLTQNNQELSQKEVITLIREIRHFLQFTFKETVPEVEEKTITIDPETEKQIIIKLTGEMCANCQYRHEFAQRKYAEQNQERLVSR
ncbi:MAG: hypothetical protein ACFFDT_00220 [Candidatus Hodarchaeota archaeon]